MTSPNDVAETTGHATLRERLPVLWLAAFAFWLWLPLVSSVVEPDLRVSLAEQRALAPLPRWPGSWQSARSLPGAIDRYYDDRLGLRDAAIRAWAWLHVEALGVSPADKLVVGREGWLFFGDAAAIAQYRGTARFSRAELLRWRRVLSERRDWLRARDIAFLVVLVPNKHRMYAEFMPTSLSRHAGTSHLDQLVELVAADPDLPVLDLRPVLLREAQGHRTYHRTDTHWNDVGAWAASRAILAALGDALPSLRDAPLPSVRLAQRTTPGKGLARIVGLSRAYPELSLDLVVVDPRAAPSPEQRALLADRTLRQLPIQLGTGDPAQPTAVVFRDSFANALVPLLSESFERVVWVWDRDVDPRVVEQVQPDVVIHEIAERFLGRRPLGIEDVRARRH